MKNIILILFILIMSYQVFSQQNDENILKKTDILKSNSSQQRYSNQFPIFTLMTDSNGIPEIEKWLSYPDLPDYVNGLADDGDNLWITAEVGLVKYNKLTRDKTLYNKINSGFPSNHIYCPVIDKNKNLWVMFEYSKKKENGDHILLARFNGLEWKYFYSNEIYSKSYICLKQLVLDSTGNLWALFGYDIYETKGGNEIFKINGDDFTVFTSENSKLPSYISDMQCDRKGNIWLLTKDGLVKFNGNHSKLFKFNNRKIIKSPPESFTIDKEGNFIFCLYSQHEDNNENDMDILKWDLSYWSYYTSNGEESIDNIVGDAAIMDSKYCFAVDKKGILWIGMEGHQSFGGLYKFDVEKITRINHDQISSISADKNGILWYGKSPYSSTGYYISEKGGLTRYDGKNFIDVIFNESPTQFNNYFLGNDDNNWFSTYDGIVQFKHGTWTYYNDSGKIFDSSGRKKIFGDRHGSLYFSTVKNHLGKFDGNNWKEYFFSNLGFYDRIYIDIRNNVYAYDEHQIFKLKDNELTVYDTNTSSIFKDEIYSIKTDNKNNLVIITGQHTGQSWNTNLVIYDNNKWKIFNRNDDTDLANTKSIFFDNKNNYYVNTKNGILLYNGTGWEKIFEKIPEWKYDSGIEIYSLLNDSIGNAWICSSEGLLKYSNGTCINLGDIYEILHSQVKCVKIDNKGFFWIATDEGLLKFDFKNNLYWIFDEDNSGIINNDIDSIEMDENGNIYILSLFNGFSMFNENGIKWK